MSKPFNKFKTLWKITNRIQLSYIAIIYSAHNSEALCELLSAVIPKKKEKKKNAHAVLNSVWLMHVWLQSVFMQPSMANLNSPSSRVVKDSTHRFDVES